MSSEPETQGQAALVREMRDRVVATALQWPGTGRLLYAPCLFCRYAGQGYYQTGTHAASCPWHTVGGSRDREVALPALVTAALAAPRAEAHGPTRAAVEALAARADTYQQRSIAFRLGFEHAIEQVLALYKPDAPAVEPTTCAWRLTEPVRLWSTACGFAIADDVIADHGDVTFCGFCGRKIVDAVAISPPASAVKEHQP